MMNQKIQDSERKTSLCSRFLETVRKADSRRSRSGVEFYTRSAMPAMLTLQSCIRQEQL